ncbi:hypothetical protein AC578_7159 [Lecanosticta acicola]|uniref:Uncharacterized protein n=1 Tax=Lecanosticta acicola TaxID=111012 RepID=A0AAI8Z005_9PEZI|nr:hypothetical protein AC578_7159 [Lecanosticta acicola]
MATDSMDVDMDIDLDMDPELQRLQAQAARLEAMPPTYQPTNDEDEMKDAEDVEEGEVGPDEIVWTKIYISGTTDLGFEEIIMFANDTYKECELGRRDLEWIDDESVKLVYPTKDHAAAALRAFSVTPVEDPLELREAVKLITNPQHEFRVRMATAKDMKKRGAAQESRFYLNHPEYDPETKRYRDRGPRRGRGGYRRDFSNRFPRARTPREESFSVDLYDDNQEARDRISARRASRQSEEDYFAGRTNSIERRGGDLFQGREQGRLRNRSASPRREGAGYYGFSDDQPYRQTAPRQRTPPLRAHTTRNNRELGRSMKADLFAGKKVGTALTNGDVNGSGAPRELFPKSKPKDLFEDKMNNHYRSDAKDLHPDEVATAIGKFDFSNIQDANTYKESGRRPENAPRDLFARTEGGPKLSINSGSGRLNERPASAGNAEGFSILGAGQKQEPISFKIKGMGKVNLPKEDLFAHKMSRKGGQRRLAEDIDN